MTDFDKKLIEKAGKFRRWAWREIDTLMDIADTDEAKDRLWTIRCNLQSLVEETL